MPISLDILFNDADLVAINKPAGLATIPGRNERTSCLEVLAAQLKLPHTGTADPRIRVVHRLDKDTSGVLLFAKNIAAQRHLSYQFQNNEIQKEYLGLVINRPTTDTGVIEARLAPHPTQKDRMTVTKQGRPAITQWQIEQRFRNHTLLRLFPKTGKTHQLRVHLLHIGHPLAVDPLYNPPSAARHGAGKGVFGTPVPGLYLSSFKRDYRPNRGEEERPLIARLTLHAHKLTFRHPNGTPTTLEAPIPKDLRATLNQLHRHGAG
jgi:23S rRNA pseudouridine1911/1915/1917 synthase